MKTNHLLFFVICVILSNAITATVALKELGIFKKQPKPCESKTRACNAFVKNKTTGLVCVFDSTGIVATFYDSSNRIGHK